MAATYRRQLSGLCGKQETLQAATELLDVALSKTGQGSGHDLGKKATALPAICALLASERLGNNDVIKKVAQDVSCLKPKDFEAALVTVQGALLGYLSRKKYDSVSYKDLCQEHGLGEDIVYWMEEVDKDLRKNEELNDIDVDEETVLYMVFYWTCIRLNIRSVKQATIISEYRVPLRAFQDLEYLLNMTSDDLKDRIDKSVSENRTSRSSPAKASPSPTKTPRKSSQIKSHLERNIESPTKTPTKPSIPSRDTTESPSKRKAVVLPPLPFMTPKKPRITSPMKLNRIPVASGPSTPSANRTAPMPAGTTPVKTYRASRSFVDDPTKSAAAAALVEALGKMEPPAEDLNPPVDLPVTPAKARIGRRATEQSSPSPRKSLRGRSPVAGPSTSPSRQTRVRTARVAPPRVVDGDIEMDSESSTEDEVKRPPCRHHLPIFADRLFYLYLDSRIQREWVSCENDMKILVEKYGEPYNESASAAH